MENARREIFGHFLCFFDFSCIRNYSVSSAMTVSFSFNTVIAVINDLLIMLKL